MANTIVGRVYKIGQTVNVSKSKEFLKRELVLDCSRYDEFSGEKRDNFVQIMFVQKKCPLLDGLQKNELVSVSFMLNGRKYEKDGVEQFITDAVGYSVERKGNTQNISAPQAPQAVVPQAPQAPQAPQMVAPQMVTPQTAAPAQMPYGAVPQQGYPQQAPQYAAQPQYAPQPQYAQPQYGQQGVPQNADNLPF